MKTDDMEFNYKQNKNQDINKLSIELEKIIKEDKLVIYVALFAIVACMSFIAWVF